MGLIALLLLVFFWPALHGHKVDKITRYYQNAERLLGKLKIKRKAHQGPYEFANELQTKLPGSINKPFSKITEAYVNFHYQPKSEKSQSEQQAMMKLHWFKMKKAVQKIKR